MRLELSVDDLPWSELENYLQRFDKMNGRDVTGEFSQDGHIGLGGMQARLFKRDNAFYRVDAGQQMRCRAYW